MFREDFTMLQLCIIAFLVSFVSAETYHITPRHNITCDNENVICLTLTEFAQSHISTSPNSNITLTFSPGNHNLSSSFRVANIRNLILSAEKANSGFLPNTTITCYGFGFNFEFIAEVSINGVEFNGCSENTVRSVGKLILNDSSFHNGQQRIVNKNYFCSGVINIMGGPKLIIIIKSSRFIDNAEHSVCIEGVYNVSLVDSEFHNNTDGAIINVYSGQGNITIHNSKFIANTAGLGGELISAQMGDSITVHNSEFIDNTAKYGGAISARLSNTLYVHSSKFVNNVGKYGGAIYVENPYGLYVTITIENSTFINNTGDSGGAIYAMHKIRSMEIHNSQFINNSAQDSGGAFYAFDVSEILIQGCYHSNNLARENGGVIDVSSCPMITVQDSHFQDNKADYGGAIRAIKGPRLDMISNTPHMSINNSTFRQNSAMQGGAIYMATVRLSSTSVLDITNNEGVTGVIFAGNSILTLSGDTIISNNSGSLYAFSSTVVFEGPTNITYNTITNTSSQQGGALTCLQSNISFQNTVIISDNCVYNGLGGAIWATESKINIVYYARITIANNTALSGGGIYAYQSELNFQGITDIRNNTAREKGGGIYAISTTTRLSEGQIQFIKNKAERGGGIYLELNAKLYVIKENPECLQFDSVCNSFHVYRPSWLRLEFTNNSADYGGAVYISENSIAGACTTDSDQSTSSECFFQGLALHLISTENLNLLNTYFTGNSASISGGTIFGGLLDRCTVSPYAEVFNKYNNLSKHKSSPDALSYLSYTTNLTPKDIQTEITSNPVRVCICKNHQPDCNYSPPPYQIKKGQTVQVSLVAVDHVNNSLPSIVRAFLSSHDGGLDQGQSIQNTTSTCTELTYTISSPHDSEQLVLYAEGPCNDIGISQTQINVQFLPCECPIGFNVSSQVSNCVCDCDLDIFPELITTCSYANESVQRRESMWINYINTSSDQYQEGYVIYPFCPFDYCHPPIEQVWIDLNVPNGADAQCAFNRTGNLCGSCKDGLSLSLGSSRCIHCSNNWLALLIVFAVAGVALVAFILVLNLTVAVGTMNGLIFYANIIAINRPTFFPFKTPNVLTVFIAWLNLDFGFVTCFYDGMDGYAKTWLQFAFPLYIIFLVAMVIIACKYSRKISNLLSKRNPVAALATLILLSYTKLIRTIISAWQFATLEYFNQAPERVWLVDANMHYFNTKHIPLFITALLVLLVGMGFTLLLLVWQWIQRVSNGVQTSEWFDKHFNKKDSEDEKTMLSCIDSPKLFSFMDAYHNPCNMKHRYWIGGLLLVRALLYLVSALNYSTNTSINILAIICVVGSLRLWKDIVKEKVYKTWPLNALEDSLFYNLIIFSTATLYIKETGGNQTSLAYTSTSIAFITFLAILVYHTYEYLIKPVKTAKTSNDENINTPNNVNVFQENEPEETRQPIEISLDMNRFISQQNQDGIDLMNRSRAECLSATKQKQMTTPLLSKPTKTSYTA